MDHRVWDINDSISVNLDKANKAFLDKGYRSACGLHLKSYFEKRIACERVIVDGIDVTRPSDNLAFILVKTLGNFCDDLCAALEEYHENH